MQQIIIGDCREVLKSIPDKSVHCVITSPPYFRLRNYGTDEQIGIESTPDEYIENLITAFKQVRRVLRDDGTCWVNIGDTYATSTVRRKDGTVDSKQKETIGIPWRFAMAMRDAGWWVRQDCIWHKTNPMPDGATDRCNSAHEYMFLFTKAPKYFYDNEAVKEQCADSNIQDLKNRRSLSDIPHDEGDCNTYLTRNKRSVWLLSVKPFKGAHFATMPPALVEPCIKAGTSEYGVCSACGTPYKRIMEIAGRYQRRWSKNNADDSPYKKQANFQNVYKTAGWGTTCTCEAPVDPATVLDPFAGSGTVGEVCKSIGRKSILVEINPSYRELIEKRIG